LVIVAASVLVGVKVLAAADDSVGVWAVRDDLPAGTRVDAAEVQRVEIRFDSREEADRYLSADAPLPDDAVLERAVGSGSCSRARLWQEPTGRWSRCRSRSSSTRCPRPCARGR
jgi:hypothetical protein